MRRTSWSCPCVSPTTVTEESTATGFTCNTKLHMILDNHQYLMSRCGAARTEFELCMQAADRDLTSRTLGSCLSTV